VGEGRAASTLTIEAHPPIEPCQTAKNTIQTHPVHYLC
jgi:hypothetical protein